MKLFDLSFIFLFNQFATLEQLKIKSGKVKNIFAGIFSDVIIKCVVGHSVLMSKQIKWCIFIEPLFDWNAINKDRGKC